MAATLNEMICQYNELVRAIGAETHVGRKQDLTIRARSLKGKIDRMRAEKEKAAQADERVMNEVSELANSRPVSLAEQTPEQVHAVEHHITRGRQARLVQEVRVSEDGNLMLVHYLNRHGAPMRARMLWNEGVQAYEVQNTVSLSQ